MEEIAGSNFIFNNKKNNNQKFINIDDQKKKLRLGPRNTFTFVKEKKIQRVL